MTEKEFYHIVSYIRDKTGVDLSQKQSLIEGRMEQYLVKNGYQSYTEYIDFMNQDLTGKEAEKMVSLLTTHHTYFLREPVHFELYKKEVLPYLREKEGTARDLRIWSAAASTGEEPYTLAMITKDFFGFDHVNWDTKILATDISNQVLEFARKGIYAQEQIQVLPDMWKKHYFSPAAPGYYEAKDELKDEVIFRTFNLMSEIPFKKRFHVIFLRNVMIYFDAETKERLLRRIYDFLEPGGYLFVGTTESVDRTAFGFEFVIPSVYRKIDIDKRETQGLRNGE